MPLSRPAPIGVGERAPDFELLDQNGHSVRLSEEWSKGPVVLFFYPRDATPTCTREVCAFRDAHAVFAEAGAVVLGVSDDPVDSHARFASNQQLPYRLLSDATGSVRTAFRLRRGLLRGTRRTTFVIDENGVIQNVFTSNRRVGQHVSTALELVRALS